MLSLPEIEAFFTKFDRSAFRLEALDRYDVDTDGGDVARYLAGEPVPAAVYKSGWLDQLRGDTAAGKEWSRVHVLRTPLDDYLRYECEWGYAYNVAAGEKVGIIDLAEQPLPSGLVLDEFWLFDDERVLLMRYDDAGGFVGGEMAASSDVPRYLAAKQAAQAVAVPFTQWWANHPHEHRKNWAA